MLVLHDTLSRSPRVLQPADGRRFRMYCCGPTVYGPAHLGNFRTFVLQDVLRRTLEAGGQEVCHVRNLTDVDDKTIRGARQAGQSLGEFTAGWTNRFHEDGAALHLLPPHHEPRATEFIEPHPDHRGSMVQTIMQLVARGHAYAAADGSVYFRIASFPSYGRLSGLDPAARQTQAWNSAGDLNDADEYEREAVADFALWKAWKPDDGANAWESPWGRGRPGWHIECSVMSEEYLGDGFDLHAGGVDLCFPHHENEIAQSEAATGRAPFCRHWFHTAHLLVEGQKMSKKLGNLLTLQDLRERGYQPEEVRLALLSGHYRQTLNFTFHHLEASRGALQKLGRGVQALAEAAGRPVDGWAEFYREYPPEVLGRFAPAWQALQDDLNLPAALGEIFKALATPGRPGEEGRADLAGLSRLCYALGLRLPRESAPAPVPAEVRQLAEARWAAKVGRQFAEADRLREELRQRGWKILDRKDGFEVVPT